MRNSSHRVTALALAACLTLASLVAACGGGGGSSDNGGGSSSSNTKHVNMAGELKKPSGTLEPEVRLLQTALVHERNGDEAAAEKSLSLLRCAPALNSPCVACVEAIGHRPGNRAGRA